MDFTTGWKKSPSLASKRENISWYKCNQSARHRINIFNLQRDTLKNRKKSKVETQKITNNKLHHPKNIINYKTSLIRISK